MIEKNPAVLGVIFKIPDGSVCHIQDHIKLIFKGNFPDVRTEKGRFQVLFLGLLRCILDICRSNINPCHFKSSARQFQSVPCVAVDSATGDYHG